MKREEIFDVKLSRDCARAYAAATKLGTVVSLAGGEVIQSYGDYNCENCGICALAGREKSLCVHSQIYGMNESERFGGKYVYFCPMGLTCFASPIVGSDGVEAKITVGPFLMFDFQDYLHDDLYPRLRPDCDEQEVAEEVRRLPVISPDRVEDLSSLMFMAVGFMNNVWAANNLLDLQESYSIQKQVSYYLAEIKGEKELRPYPFELENKLLDHIVHLERETANSVLNEILGYIFFAIGNDLQIAKSRIYELLVLMSRAAITAGADSRTMLTLTHDYLQIIPRISSMEDLCTWMAKVMNKFMDLIFQYNDVKHANVIHQATRYMRTHYAEKISLDSVARMTYLSPTYFSRVFRQETGETFNAYLNNVRIQEGKKLLMNKSIELIDISMMTGFDNQSYFTKVFKKCTGMSPLQYRQKKCREMASIGKRDDNEMLRNS